MKRIAVYSGYPMAGFSHTDYASYRKAMGLNSGNLIFKVGSLLSACEDIDQVDFISLDQATIEACNERYEYVLFAGANLINPAFRHIDFAQLAKAIERLKIPFVTLSIGAQASIDYNPALYRRLDKHMIRFLHTLSDACQELGSRGDYTTDQLSKLGIRNVTSIGCPSIYAKGIELLKSEHAWKEGPTVCNISPTKNLLARTTAHAILKEAIERKYELVGQTTPLIPKLLYFPAEIKTADLDDFSAKIWQLFLGNRLHFFSSFQTWLTFLARASFTFGMRIHGNIAAALAGTPCHIITYDSRIREIAEHLRLPNSDFRKLSLDGKLPISSQLSENTDMSSFRASFPVRLGEYTELLNKNGVRHNIDSKMMLKSAHTSHLQSKLDKEYPYYCELNFEEGQRYFEIASSHINNARGILRWKAIEAASFAARLYSRSRWSNSKATSTRNQF